MMKDNTNSGFSLIELIIAMTILLVLSGMIFLGSDSGDLRSLCVDFTVPDCRCSHCYRHTSPPPRKPQEESPSSGAADAGGAERIRRPQSAQYNRLTEHAYGDRDTIVCNEGLAQKCQPFMFRFWISVRQFDIIRRRNQHILPFVLFSLIVPFRIIETSK